MEHFKRIVLNILKTIFCLFVTGDILYTGYMLDGSGGYTFQQIIWMCFLIIFAVAAWSVLFSQQKPGLKLAVVIIIILFNYCVDLFPEVRYAFDLDNCLDMGICAEGLEVKTEHGLIKINKESCLKYGFEWNEKKLYCYLRN